MNSRKLTLSLVVALLLLGGLVCLLLTPHRGRERGPPSPAGGDGRTADADAAAGAAQKTGAAQGGPSSGAALEAPAGQAQDEPPPEADTRSISLEGRVTDEKGEGVSGAKLMALDKKAWAQAMDDDRDQLEKEPLKVIRIFHQIYRRKAAAIPSTLTARDGAYALRGLNPADYQVLATQADYLPTVAAILAP